MPSPKPAPASKLLHMADSVDAAALPVGMDAYAGYVGGFWPDYSEIVQRFPKAYHKSVAVNALENADILDCENGDAVPSECPAWIRRQIARGVKRPGVYANASEMPLVRAALNADKLKRAQYVLWTADWDGNASLDADSEAKQYADPAVHHKGNYDLSVYGSGFFATVVPVPAKNPPRYDWYPNLKFNIFGNGYVERTIVKRYDRLRAQQTPTKHPHRAELAVLRKALDLLAKRVYRVSHKQLVKKGPKKGKPSWGLYHRGWRFQQLIHRAQGQRVV